PVVDTTGNNPLQQQEEYYV
nr:RecName: Full=Kunitz-type serine protease inhibitor 1; Short=Xb-KTI [Xanthosoma sagittifolium]